MKITGKIRKIFISLFSLLMASVFYQSGVSKASSGLLYGVPQVTPVAEPTFWEKILPFLAPIVIVTGIVLGTVIGIVIFTKRKMKNVKKNP